MRLLIILMLVFTTGCTSLHPLKSELNQNELAEKLEINEEVVILTKSGEKFALVIKEINEEAIVGAQKQVKFENIETINNQQFNVVKTAGLLAGTGLIVGILAGIAFIAAF